METFENHINSQTILKEQCFKHSTKSSNPGLIQ